jgi:hypothetical protein
MLLMLLSLVFLSNTFRLDHIHPSILYSWNHIKCFTFPKALQKEGATVESFLSEDLDDPDDLIEEHREEIMEGIESKAAKKTPVKKAAADSSTMLGKIKRNYQAVEGAAADDDDNEDRPAKKAKLSASEKEEVELYETYMSKNAEELKDYMRYVFSLCFLFRSLPSCRSFTT